MSTPPPTTSTHTPPTTSPLDSQSPTSSAPPETRQAGIFDALGTIRLHDFTTFHQAPCARESLLTGIGAGFAIGGLRFVVLSRTGTSNASNASSTPSTSPNTSSIGSARIKTETISAGGTASNNQDAAAHRPRPGPPSGPASKTQPKPSSPSIGRPTRLQSLSSRAWRSMTWAVLSFSLFSVGAHVFCQRRRKLEKAAMARATEIVNRKRAEKRAEIARRKEERESKRLDHEREKSERSRWGGWFGGVEKGKGTGTGSGTGTKDG